MSCAAHARNSGGHGSGHGGGATVSALSCSSGSLSAAGSDTCTVALSAAAGSGGLPVTLSSNSSLVRVPSSVTVGRGSTSAGFTARISAFSGTQTVLLTATAGGASTTFAIQLSASAGTAALSLQSTSVAFGDVAVNTAATQSVVLTSSGTAPLTISGASVTGTGFSGPGMSLPVTLNPSQSATLQLQFDPSAAGSATGSVTLSSNASNAARVTIALSGTGTSSSYHVALAWNAPGSSPDPVAGYNVYRAASGSSSYQLMNPAVDAQTAYTDSAVQSGSSYTYYVESVDAGGVTSAPSNVISVSVP